MQAQHKVLGIIRGDHQTLAAVIDALKHVSAEVAAGTLAPDYKLAWSILYYIEEYPEKIHHPKEEEALFPRLRGRNAGIDDTLDELRRQHDESGAYLNAMKTALGWMEAEIPGANREFSRQVERFAQFHYQHMNTEEGIVLPKAREVLVEEDWEAIAAAFALSDDPYRTSWNDSDSWFRDFYSRLVTLVPAPWGVGPRNEPRGR